MSRLRVALETQFAFGTPTGLGTYATGLARALRDRDDIDVIALEDPRFDLWRFDRRVFWDQVRAPQLARRADADVFHFTGGTLPLTVPRPAVLTVHDLVWLREANRGRWYVRSYFGGLQRRLARRADALVVDTHAARADVADGLGVAQERIAVVGCGVDDAFFSLVRRPSLPPFALAVGTVEERKDLATAVRAIADIPGLRLIAPGPFTPYADAVREQAARSGVSDRVQLPGYVDDAALLDLYARATLLVSASRYEGFGLPPLQALACGLPVVAADIPVTREVLADCAAYAQPGDATDFADAMRAIVERPPLERIESGRARALEFAWSEVAQRAVDVYRRLTR